MLRSVVVGGLILRLYFPKHPSRDPVAIYKQEDDRGVRVWTAHFPFVKTERLSYNLETNIIIDVVSHYQDIGTF